jgi:repressor of nif and glnA expression
LVVVPPSVAATSPSAVVKAKGATQDPWAAFCESGEILTAATAKDMAGTMSQRMREVSQQLSQQLTQQLKQVNRAGLRCLLCFGSCVCVS